MTKRDVRDYLQDILTHINLAEQFIAGMTFEQFQADDKTILAVTRALEVIGEAAKQIPLALREHYPQIPWKGVTGMRDKLIHAYFGVQITVLWDTTQQDLPPLKPVIQAMLHELSSHPETP